MDKTRCILASCYCIPSFLRRPEYPTTASMIINASSQHGRELHSNFEAQAPHFHPTFGTAYMEAFDALLTMRVKSWTTSDIGGLNSGSCCTRSFKLVVCLSSRKGDDRSKISLFYLNAAANNVSKTRQCLFRTLSLNGRIYHLCYGINIIELRSGPSHQMLFSPWT